MPTPATPYLEIDGPTTQQNIDRLAAYSQEHDIAIRPHTKTHKSELLARMQLEAGAPGLTVAKVGEADVMSRVADDLLIAYPLVDSERTVRAARLAMHNTLRVAVDSKDAIQKLSAAASARSTTIGILVDLDVGLHRTGVQTPNEALVLAQLVDRSASLRLDGLFSYSGHVWASAETQEPLLREISDVLRVTLDIWAEHGLEAGIVSGGSTPTCYQSHYIPELTEIRPGTYVYNDVNTWRGGYCQLEDCSARIVATVVSNAVPGQIVIDAGSKTLTSDLCFPAPESGHGYIVEYPEAKIAKLTEEHGQVDITACSLAPKIGERVHVVPNHICPCVNLQDRFWWKDEQGDVEPLAVDARGKLS